MAANFSQATRDALRSKAGLSGPMIDELESITTDLTGAVTIGGALTASSTLAVTGATALTGVLTLGATATNAIVTATYKWGTVDLAATRIFFVAPRALTVVAITARPEVLGSGGAVTLDTWKAPSATAIGSGTRLVTNDAAGLINIGNTAPAGVAFTNQSPTLSAVGGALTLAAGDALGVVLAGTPTGCVGCLTIAMTPA